MTLTFLDSFFNFFDTFLQEVYLLANAKVMLQEDFIKIYNWATEKNMMFNGNKF